MTWTFRSDFDTARDRVRIQIGDIDTSDQLISDEGIAYAATLEGSDTGTAARCCEWIAAKFSRLADIQEGRFRLDASQRSEAYLRQAQTFRNIDAAGAPPFIGGQSVSDKESLNSDTDRVMPAFFRGMMDNPESQKQSVDSDQVTDPFNQNN